MLKRLITTLAIMVALIQPALSQTSPWGDLPGAPGAQMEGQRFPGGQFPGGRVNPGFFPGGQFPTGQMPDYTDPSGGLFPGGQFPQGTGTQPQQTPAWYPWPYWIPNKGKSTGRGIGRRYDLPPTSTSSVDLDIVDGVGGNGNPQPITQPGLPVNIPTPRITPQPPERFPGGQFSGPNPSELPNAS